MPPLLAKVLKCLWIAWLVLGAWLLKSCDSERDYRIHPVTDSEAEAMDAMHSR